MPKTPPPARVGRRQPDPPPTPDAPVRAKTGPRAIPLALLVPIDQIEPDPAQPRRDHGAESLAALADSLTEYGVLQPLLVREGDEGEDGRARYRIIAGGRRYAAALLAGLTRLPVVVRDTEGATLRLTQLVENIQRQDLAPLEEARAFQELMDAEGLNAEELATRLHISGQQIRERLRLLSDQVLADAVERKQIAPSVARAVQRLPVVAQEPLRARIKAGETLPLAEVHEVKERTAAAGVTNPRAKGGGRGRHKDQAVLDLAVGPKDQALLDRPPLQSPLQSSPAAEGFRRALQALDHRSFEAVLVYGADRGWSCEKLLQVLRDDERGS